MHCERAFRALNNEDWIWNGLWIRSWLEIAAIRIRFQQVPGAAFKLNTERAQGLCVTIHSRMVSVTTLHQNWSAVEELGRCSIRSPAISNSAVSASMVRLPFPLFCRYEHPVLQPCLWRQSNIKQYQKWRPSGRRGMHARLFWYTACVWICTDTRTC